jgi:hypothetical protein
MQQPNRIIIYSHGFGVRKDDRGLFTDIAAALPGAGHVMFDYNRADEAANTLTVAPLGEQAQKLGSVIAETRAKHPDAVIDLVCHSQGCVAAALLKSQGIRKTIFTAPPAELTIDNMRRIFGSRPGSHIDIDGVSTLSRRDGSTTIVPEAYWRDIQNISPIALYNSLAQLTELLIINATQDEILGKPDFTALAPSIKTTELNANHDFTGTARAELLGTVSKELDSDE